MKLITDDFKVIPSSYDEEVPLGATPENVAFRFARQKTLRVYFEHTGEVVIGADTIVTLRNHIFTKPKSTENAIAMLTMLSGNIHTVYTAVCILLENGKDVNFVDETHVEFYPLTAKEIKDYVETGEPMDKAGAYGIQGRGALFVKKIYGDFYNVMGLPVAHLNRVLQKNKVI